MGLKRLEKLHNSARDNYFAKLEFSNSKKNAFLRSFLFIKHMQICPYLNLLNFEFNLENFYIFSLPILRFGFRVGFNVVIKIEILVFKIF